MSKDHLIFDTSDANSILASDSVGAYLRASDGTLLTHTDVSGKKALDVRLAEGVNVEVDLSHEDDSVRLGDGTDFFTSTTVGSDIGLDVNLINASIAVTATDLDIRNLLFASDSVDVSGSSVSISGDVNVTQGTDPWVVSATDLDIRNLLFASDSVDVSGSSVSISGDVNVTQGTDPWVVSATDLDIRDLAAANDSVSAWLKDGSGTSITSTTVGSDQALDVNIVQSVDPSLANTAIAHAAETLDVANTAQSTVASILSNRKMLFVYNKDNQIMYIGGAGVSAASGFPISPGSYMELIAGASIDVKFVSAKLNHEIRTLELA